MGNGRSLSQVTQENKGPFLPVTLRKTERTLQKTPERWLALPMEVSGQVEKAAARSGHCLLWPFSKPLICGVKEGYCVNLLTFFFF